MKFHNVMLHTSNNKYARERNTVTKDCHANADRRDVLMFVKKFDLNIENMLEDWEIYHAIREIISNTIDEQMLTKTKDIEIFQEKNNWHIMDYGHGLKYEHLMQKETEEKLKNRFVIVLAIPLFLAIFTVDPYTHMKS
jgi:DNA gyrase/topoisomerase IV subunit B